MTIKKLKLSDSKIPKLELPQTGKRIEYRDETTGLVLRVSDKGIKSWIVKRYINGKHQRKTIGNFPSMNCSQARLKASALIGEIDSGIDLKEKGLADENEQVTLKSVLTDYLKLHRDRLKPKTIKQYSSTINFYCEDWLDSPIINIDDDLVAIRHEQISQGKITGQKKPSKAQADLWARIIRALFNFAIVEYRGQNKEVLFTVPTKILSHNKQWHHVGRKQTHIRKSQLKGLLDGLDEYRKTYFEDFNGRLTADALEFALFTGLRKEEILSLTWERVDIKSDYFWIDETKNGQPLELPITKTLKQIFARRKLEKFSPFVFGTPAKSGRISDPKKAVLRVSNFVGIKLGWHDCRRTFAGQAEAASIGSYTVKRLLNHKTKKDDVTAGYIVQSADELSEPATKVEQQILIAAGRAKDLSNLDQHLSSALSSLTESDKRKLLFEILNTTSSSQIGSL
jgi:integrase